MAQLVISAAGAAIGSLFGAPQIGWAIGSVIGASLFPTKTEGPRLSDLRVSGTEYGQVIPWVAGSPRISGQIIWASEKRETGTTQSQGKGGGPEYTTYTYDVDLLYLLSENEIVGISRVWLNGDLVYGDGVTRSGVWSDIRVLTGASDQLPDPTYEAAVGSANAIAYRTRGCVLIQGLQLGQSGQIPNLTFEIGTFVPDIYATSASILCSVFTTRRDTNPGPFDKYDISYTSLPTFDSYFAEFGSNALLSTNYYTNFTAPGRIFNDGSLTPVALPDKNIEINSNNEYIFESVNGFWSGDIADCVLEFKNSSNEVIAAISTLDAGATEFTNKFRYGVNLSSMTLLSENIVTKCKLTFNDGSLICTNIDGHTFSGPAPGFTLACDAKSITSVTISGVRVKSTYTGAETNPYAIVRLQKVPLEGSDGGSYYSLQDVYGVVNNLLLRCGYSQNDFDSSGLQSITKPVRGLAISQNGNTRTILETLQSAYFFEVAKSDKIYFRPRASSPVATIDYDDLATRGDISEDVEPFALKFANDLETPAQVSVSFNNMEADYQIGTEYSDRLISGQESVTNVQIPLGFTSAEGKGIADAILLDQIASQNSATITLPLEYAYLEPSDVVTISTPDRSYRARLVTKKESNGIIEFDLVLDDANALESAEITDSDYPTQPTVQQIASTLWEALDIPLLRDADNTPGFYVVVKPDTDGDLWPGAGFFSSWNDISYANLLTFSSRATFGTCTTTLGNWTGGNRFDETNTLTVNVGAGTLSSSTRSAMLNDLTINVMVVGSELIRFRTATLVSTGVYTLSGLIRGFRGTEWAIGGHVASERCILLDSAVLRSVSQTSELNLLRYIKAVTSGFTLGSATSEQFTDTGVCLKPFSVANPRALASGSDVVVTWDRRTRLSYVYGGTSPTVPLGEAFERYRIRVYDGSNLVRTEEVSDAQTFTYTAAMISADGFASTDVATFEIVQLSEIIGEGYPAEVEGIIP